MAQEIKKNEAAVTPARRFTDPFGSMRAEMDRVFDSFLGRGLGRLPSLTEADPSSGIMPSIDVRENATEFVVEAELPGIEEKDVTLTLNDGVLMLKGEKKSEREDKQDGYHLTERSYGSFRRSFRVADTVDTEKVVASFDKGVLKITMPKRPEALKQEKRIPIGKT